MEWLFPSVIAILAGSLILIFVYSFLYQQDRERHMAIWSWGWVIYALRFVFMLASLAAPDMLALTITNQLCALVSGILLLWGTYAFLGKTFPRWWWPVTVLGGLWIIITSLLHLTFPIITIPTFAFLGAVSAWTGIMFLRAQNLSKGSRKITGWAYVTWGIHKADYPFLRPVLWFAPWGYLLGAILEFVVAIGMLLIYFQKNHQDLQTSEARWRSLTEESPDHIVVIDRDLTIEFVNFASPGLTVEELIGKPLYTFVEKERQPEIKAIHEEVIKTGKPVSYETQYTTPAGSTIYYESRATPRVLQGKIIGLTISARDITERKRAEEAVREAEAKYRSLVEQVPVITYVGALDQASSTLYISPQIEQMLGFAADEWVKDPDLWAKRLHPDDRERVLGEVAHSHASDEPLHSEYRLVARDGHTVWVRDEAVIVHDEAGRPLVLQGIMLDITQQKRAEEERQTHLWFLESMDRVNRAMQGTNDLEQMMSDVLDTVLSIFDCDRAYLLYPCDPGATSWSVPMERTRPGYPGVRALGREIPMDQDVAETFRILLNSAHPVKFGPGTRYPLPPEMAERFRLKSFISMALYPKVGKPWQFGIHQCSYPRTWTPDEERLLQGIGQRLTDALTSLLAYRSLQESELRYRELFENSSECIFLLDVTEDGQFKFAEFNPAEERAVGFSNAEVSGKFVEEAIPAELAQQVTANYRRCVEAGTLIEYDEQLNLPVGRRDFHTNLIPVRNATGDIYRIVGIARDITEQVQTGQELQRSNDLLRAIIEAAPAAIIGLDLDGNVQSVWNPAAEKMLGWSSLEVMGRPLPSVPVEGQEEFRGFRERIRSGQTLDGVEARRQRRDGSPIDFSIYASPLRDTEGRITGNIAVLVDITERKRIESELRRHRDRLEELVDERTQHLKEANEQLARLSRIKDEFVSNVSHELRSPIANLKLREFLLENHPDDLVKHLAVMRRETERLERTIEDLLQLSRLDQSQTESIRRVVDLNLLIDQLVSDRIMVAQEQGLTLTVGLGEDVQPILADEGLLIQALSVLLTNAINYTPPGGEIGVTTQATRFEDQEWAGISVSDTGLGIPQDEQSRLFERFFRGKVGRESGAKGTGLGLALAKGIVDRHEGRIEVKSEGVPGKGTTFTIWLPGMR